MSGKLVSCQIQFPDVLLVFCLGSLFRSQPWQLPQSLARLGCVSRSRVTLPPRGLIIRWQIATHKKKKKNAKGTSFGQGSSSSLHLLESVVPAHQTHADIWLSCLLQRCIAVPTLCFSGLHQGATLDPKHCFPLC